MLNKIIILPLQRNFNAGGSPRRGLRGAYRLGNANNGSNAGSVYLNGNNAPTNANANLGVALNRSFSIIGRSLASWPNISKDDSEIVDILTIIPVGTIYRRCPSKPTLFNNFKLKMKRIKEDALNESEEIVRAAWDDFSDGKHSRPNICAFEAELEANLREVLAQIQSGSFVPQGYTSKVIKEKKVRVLAKAPVFDHVAETAVIYPYQQKVYDKIAWQAPAVRPGLGTHAMVRFLRNDLFNHTQQELYYNFTLDIHHYFPMMDHAKLKERIDAFFAPGKVRTVLYRVVDSYLQGIPLGIKIAQLFGMMYLSDFDRQCMCYFHIRDDPDKLAYWTSRYITERIMTAKESDYNDLSQGSQYLARPFESYLDKGLQHYYRFVDNIIILHSDKTFLRIVRELVIVHLTRDYHCTPNRDHAIRPTYTGIHICGYVFYHEKVLVDKRNKKKLAKKAEHLFKCGANEEDVRRILSSNIGFVKHANSTNFLKSIGMEKTLGKIIKKRRIRSPFEGLTADNKEKFSRLICNVPGFDAGNHKWDGKILIIDFIVSDSKIEKSKQVVKVTDSNGQLMDIEQEQAEKVLAFKYKKILKTITGRDNVGREVETYICVKKIDQYGNPTQEDAEFYTYTGSKIMIDQMSREVCIEDLPCPAYVKQSQAKNGKIYTKFE